MIGEADHHGGGAELGGGPESDGEGGGLAVGPVGVVDHRDLGDLAPDRIDGPADDDDGSDAGVDRRLDAATADRCAVDLGEQFVGGAVESATGAGCEHDRDGDVALGGAGPDRSNGGVHPRSVADLSDEAHQRSPMTRLMGESVDDDPLALMTD